MYEFFIGVFIGYISGLVIRERQTRSVGIQVDEVWSRPVSSQPIFIRNLYRWK